MDRILFRYLRLTFQLLDVIVLNLIFGISYYILSINESLTENPTYLSFLFLLNGSWVIISWILKLYTINSIESLQKFTKNALKAYLVWLVVGFFYLFFFRQLLISRFFILSTFSFFSLGLLANRFIYLLVREYYKDRADFRKRIIILGYNKLGVRLAEKLGKNVNNQILGFVEDESMVNELSPYPILGDISDTINISKNLSANHIFSTISPKQNGILNIIMPLAEKNFIRFRIVPDFSFYVDGPIHFDPFDGLPMISIRNEPLEDTGNRAKKRILDIIVSLLVVIFILSWLMPLIALLIYIESRGPIFFIQNRSGKNNKPFRCFKFRSMKTNNDAEKRQASVNDARFTKIGKFLRKTSLDEFPQFLNVLKGEMSLVGPRPHMLKHTEEWSEIAKGYHIRQYLKPGITGWAQINGYRGEIRDKQQLIGRIEADIWYSESWTLWLDFRILVGTILKTIKGDENAY